MLQRIIHRLLLRRHFWRDATFSEVAELYASRTMRIFALRIISVFTSVYLFQKGYSLLFIALFWAGFYLYKACIAWAGAQYIARFGPKHATLMSNILAAIGLLFLPLESTYGVAALVAWCIFQATSTSVYDLAYLVSFSKVKNVEHAGKEIAYMNILEKVATSVAPIIGGFLAFVVSPESVMWISAALFMLSVVPLLKTGEPVSTRQRLSFDGFPWRATLPSLRAEAAIGVDLFTTGTAWTLFMAVAVFAGEGSEMYAKIGLLSSIAVVAALTSSYVFGRLIDRNKGGELLRFGVMGNSLVHLLRAFVTTPYAIAMTNIMNEAATTGYAMAFTRGLFDTADSTGKRIAFFFLIEVVINLGAAAAALLLAGLLYLVSDPGLALQASFTITALVTLLIATPRFALYKK